MATITQPSNYIGEYRVNSSCLYISDGIKQMLVQLIYFHYTREQGHKNTQSGTINVNAENSVKALSFNDIAAYNAGISNYQIIQWYICDNPINSTILDDDYNGNHLDFTSGI